MVSRPRGVAPLHPCSVRFYIASHLPGTSVSYHCPRVTAPGKVARVTQAMMKMIKLDIATPEGAEGDISPTPPHPGTGGRLD
jgi:hypothetical protein